MQVPQTVSRLIESAQHHQEPLRLTTEFYQQVAQYLHDLYQTTPGLPEVITGVDDGSENVKLIDGEWTFRASDPG